MALSSLFSSHSVHVTHHTCTRDLRKLETSTKQTRGSKQELLDTPLGRETNSLIYDSGDWCRMAMVAILGNAQRPEARIRLPDSIRETYLYFPSRSLYITLLN